MSLVARDAWAPGIAWESLFDPYRAMRLGHRELVDALRIEGPREALLHAGWSPPELLRLRQGLPDANAIAVDLASAAVGLDERFRGWPDAVALSYVLSKLDVDWEAVLDAAWRDLRPGGLIGVVDFHDTPLPAFRRWMAARDVRVQPRILAELGRRFVPLHVGISGGALGTWRYVVFVGRKGAPPRRR
jgi:hypothetical protein